MLLDVFCLFAAFALTIWISLRPDQEWASRAASHSAYYVVFALIWCVTATDQGLFLPRRGESLTAILFSVTRVYFITLLLSGFGLALLLRGEYSRMFFAAFALSELAMMLAAVLVLRPGVSVLRGRHNACRVLFVGADERSAQLAQSFLADERQGYQVVGFLEENQTRGRLLEQLDIPHLGKVCEIEKLLIDRTIDEVYLSLPLGDHYEDVQNVAQVCETIGVPVRLVGDMFPIQLSSCDIGRIGDIPLLSLMTRPQYLTNIQLRRATEAVTAFLLLIALFPLFSLIALLIKIGSRGPVLISKPHPKGNGRQVNTLSFRVHSLTDAAAPSEKLPRPNRLGQFLRRYDLEDLPQLLDVIMGRISYTGASVSRSKRAVPLENTAKEPLSRRKPRILPTVVLAVLDACCVTVAYVLAIWVTVPGPEVVNLSMMNNIPFWGVLLLAWYGAAIERQLWRWRTVEPLGPCAFGLLKAMGNAAVVCGFLLAILVPGAPSTRRFLVVFCVFAFVALLMFRVSNRFLTRIFYFLGYRIRRVAVVGANERTGELIQALGSEARFGYKVEGVLEDEQDRTDSTARFGVPYLGGVGILNRLLAEQKLDEVYVTLPVRSHFNTIKTVVDLCGEAGIPVHVVAHVLPLRVAKSRTVLIQDIPLISLSSMSETYAWEAIKRVTDFMASTILLAIFTPLFALLAILIKLDSKGPVFFVQNRIGRNHRHFRMIKFRSMGVDAEERKKDMMHLNEADGPVFKIKNDPRVTQLGAYLRKYSLDELPQLFNVWLGQMSLVGPRPLMPHEVEKFEWFERRRLSVKPGMTGPWQVSGRCDIPFKEWVEMDLAYIDSWSFWQDFRILLKTFNAVFSGRGAT